MLKKGSDKPVVDPLQMSVACGESLGVALMPAALMVRRELTALSHQLLLCFATETLSLCLRKNCFPQLLSFRQGQPLATGTAASSIINRL